MEMLNDNQFRYVMFHLNQHIDLSEIKRLFSYGSVNTGSGIFFSASQGAIDEDVHLVYKGETVPVLFPGKQSALFFEMKENQLIFHHDILKAAFYLLSAYQEIQMKEPDRMGRFRFDESIQKRINGQTKPTVNYYFHIISDGLELYCRHNQLEFKRKRLFESFGFMLTHDVDRVDYYHWRETALKWMQLVGLKKLPYDKKRLFKAALNAVLPTLFPGFKPNPRWNFKALRKDEERLGLKSVWYFLNRDGSPHDARYFLEEKRMTDLMQFLSHQHCEIALHGSLKTAQNASAMIKAKTRVENACKSTVVGARQHFLKFHYPETLHHQQAAGIKYDTTMGFAEHEGFRNSYCYPFRPYDHKNDRMMDIWEFPLAVMDTTLFSYRNLDYKDMQDAVNAVTGEVERFGGLLVMLWHNCNLDEYQYPGINQHYKQQLSSIAERRPQSVTGADVLSLL